ncbi:MAG: 5-formyltetrahydrofolate cyclo-ligase [Clostridia bacterium]|nr:5-formyltetrahydrofolate cyclo-ligase [Clostridia bacterium]
MNKNELRNIIRKRADGLSDEYIKSASCAIAEKLINLQQFKECESLFIYVSTPKEPDTFHIINEALKSGKKVYVPKCGQNHTMKAIRIHSTDELQAGYMGISEPVGTEEADRIDIAVIPCICASTDGKRLGHGAGFYDRFLADCDAAKICLCFERLISDDIPMDKHDIYIDIVITEKIRDA